MPTTDNRSYRAPLTVPLDPSMPSGCISLILKECSLVDTWLQEVRHTKVNDSTGHHIRTLSPGGEIYATNYRLDRSKGEG